MTNSNFQQLANFIWSVADLLRGPYRPPQYERVMLPLTVLRRFDVVLALTKDEVLKRYEALKAKNTPNIDAILNNLAKDEDGRSLGFHNHSQLDFYKLKGDPDNIGRHLEDYIQGFSENIRKIFERCEFSKEIEKLEESNRLYQVVAQFAEIDLHPKRVDNITMGLVFEDLIRRFNESANETAGDHFTPKEVIQLMVNLLLEPDTDVLTQAGVIVTICDPACGTGGMLAEAQNWIRAHNEQATVKVYGQDYNPRSYAVAASDLLIKGQKDTCQLKHTWASSDYGLSESIRDEGDIAVLRMSCIVDGRVDVSKSGMITEVDGHLLLRRNDLLFNRTNSLDQIAKVGLLDYDPDEPLTFASYLVRIRTNHRATPQYLVALLNSSLFLEFARKNAIPAIGQANLNPTRYGEIQIPLPPKAEQEEIVTFLGRDAEISTPVREHIRSSISLLKERRAALITAAVTGQIPLEEMRG